MESNNMLFSNKFWRKIRNMRKKYSFLSGYIVGLFGILYLTGLYQYFLTWSYSSYYTHWGSEEPLGPLINQLERGEVMVKPINEFNFPFTFINREKCSSDEPVKLLFLVKSSLENFNRRDTIRNSWGYENRFSDIIIRTVFLVGMNFDNTDLQSKLEKEANVNKDIVQAEFNDAYFNNTIKFMMGLYWSFHYCENVKYFFFVDDDYYVSTRNTLRFLRSPNNYPKYLEKFVASAVNEYQENLYAGYVFPNSSPIRFYFSKWYISLKEYPYSHWPPYVTAGSVILSRKSLVNIYYASIYTKFVRFDDIFLAMSAKKADVKPFHHPEFYFEYKPYSLEGYKYVISSHGFDDPLKLHSIWTEQRSAGNA